MRALLDRADSYYNGVWQHQIVFLACAGLELGAGWTVTLVERTSGTQAGGTDK